ncbi:MAG: hypothetical protein JWO54_931 [Candidatus Saccharibacteria bacterium]|nr:hypothetical protein [Candidatus Saccharibacteria bacterium]
MSRVCIFCHREGQPLTREHVYPDWLSKLFDPKILGTNVVSGANVNRVWQGAVFQQKVKLVCAECNNGWMSDIEGSVKDLLTSLAFTYDGHTLSQEDQRRLSLWVQKTVLVINKSLGSESGFDIPVGFYDQLYVTRQPINTILVTVGWRMQTNGPKNQPLASFEIKQVSIFEVEKNSVDAINGQMDDGALVWSAILALGNVVFHVVGTSLEGQLEVGSSDPRMLIQINPYHKDLSWPLEWPIEAVGGLDAIRKGM